MNVENRTFYHELTCLTLQPCKYRIPSKKYLLGMSQLECTFFSVQQRMIASSWEGHCVPFPWSTARISLTRARKASLTSLGKGAIRQDHRLHSAGWTGHGCRGIPQAPSPECSDRPCALYVTHSPKKASCGLIRAWPSSEVKVLFSSLLVPS